MISQLALDLAASGLNVRAITTLTNGNMIAECTATEWRQAYADRLLKRGWYTVRFGQIIEYEGHVGRIASTDVELQRIVTGLDRLAANGSNRSMTLEDLEGL